MFTTTILCVHTYVLTYYKIYVTYTFMSFSYKNRTFYILCDIYTHIMCLKWENNPNNVFTFKVPMYFNDSSFITYDFHFKILVMYSYIVLFYLPFYIL